MARADFDSSASARFENTSNGLTVHVVGRLTPAVLSFLRPATVALSGSGATQALIAIDDAFGKAHLQEFPPELARVLVPDHRSCFQRVGRLRAHLNDVVRYEPIAALHLHGVLPALASAQVIRGLRGSNTEVFFFPHSSRALTGLPLIRSAIMGLIKLLLSRTQQQSIVNVPADARFVQRLSEGQHVKIVENAVADVFFEVARHEARRPLLVTSGREESLLGASSFSQLAVLMGDDHLGLDFNWIGPVNPLTQGVFEASGVGHVHSTEAAEVARRLGTAWVYVAAVEERGFPVGLVEAMAAGLPAVVIDGENHAHVLRHGHTGFVCKDQIEMVTRIAELIDSAELRTRMGAAARQEAQSRFSDTVFRERLLGDAVN